MSSTTLARFFTQRRLVYKNGEETPWDDVCLGHEHQSDAIICQDGMRAAMLGEDSVLSVDPRNAEAIHVMNFVFETACKHEMRTELRMIKVTQTIEIVESADVVTRDRVQPKKEVP